MADALKNKIDFVMFASVTNANSNGDPLNDNRPRVNSDGCGVISDVCIKRKIRNRMQDFGCPIFVQSSDRADDGMASLRERACSLKQTSPEEYAKRACETWLDVRCFGQVFAFSGFDYNSLGIRGPVTIHHAESVDPVEVESMGITRSVSGELKSGQPRGSDTMGTKHFVRFGLYKIKGSINVGLAAKTGFSREDAEVLKKCLCTLFENDASAARPDGSMEVVKLFWFEHSCPNGQYPSAKVHRSVNARLKEGVLSPRSTEDYEFFCEELSGLRVEVIED